MLVVPVQSPPLFVQSVKKVKEQPSGRLVLCLSGLTKALALLFLPMVAVEIGFG